jgi:hypothetical protein
VTSPLSGNCWINANQIYIKTFKDWKQSVKGNQNLSDLNLIKKVGFYKIITMSGINVMIAYMNSKTRGDAIRCYTCKDLESLQDNLEKLQNSEFEGKIAYIVHSGQFRSFTFTARHTTPVLIEKDKEKMKIFVMDSAQTSNVISPKGSEGHDLYNKLILEGSCHPLKELYPHNVYMTINNANLTNAEIFINASARQKDLYTCPIFSLSDVKHFFERENFFEEIEQFGQLENVEKDEALFYVHNLPPEHMKMTRSLSQIADYQKNSAIKPYSEKWNLQNSVQKSRRLNHSGHKINMKAQDRHCKYIKVLTEYARTKSAEELKDMAARFDAS